MPGRLALAAAFLALTACSPSTEETSEAVDTTEGVEVAPQKPDGPSANAQALTADHVANLIAADGAAHTLAVLTGPADPTGFDAVTAGVATGDAGWLGVAQSLRPEADGMYAEGLSEALYQALSKNAAGVLAVLKATGGASELSCQDAWGNEAAVAAVSAVTDPALAHVKQECLGYMSGPIEG